jgi:hypothetical protein
VNKVCWSVQFKPAFREQIQNDPAAALAPFKLTEEERRALLEGDVVWLFQNGAHPFLLGHLGRWNVLGVTRKRQAERMGALLTPENRARLEGSTA